MNKTTHARSAFMKAKILICGLLLAGVFLIVFGNEISMNLKRVKNLLYLFEIIKPPKDLYQDLVNEELALSKKKEVFEFNFEHKYNGKHNAGIYLDNFTNDLYTKKTILKMKVEIAFYDKDNLVLSKVIEEFSPFLGRNGDGYMMLSYSVPNDLPNKVALKCKVKILEYDFELSAKHGPLRFYIRKMSDM